MNNWIGIIVSFVFVFVVIGISSLLSHFKLLNNEGSRKFIHIGVSNWWIIAMIFFDHPVFAAFVPAMFVGINYLSYKKQVFSAMERDGSKRDLGTVYYALSLLILSTLSFSILPMYIGAIGILIMGYGDGFAAVVGKRWGKHRFGNLDKSVEGSLTVFFFALLISFILYSMDAPTNVLLKSLIIAVSATFFEAISPEGFDNLTVPLGSSLIAILLMGSFDMSFLISFALSLLIAGLAYLRKSLTLSGFISAIILGTIVYGFGRPLFFWILMAFFGSSILIRKLMLAFFFSAHKNLIRKSQKHEARTWVQVWANGGILGLFSVLYHIYPTMLVVFCGCCSIAASTADTWASEIGVLSHHKPKSLIRGEEMETGLSGGVTPLGLWASAAGSAFIALTFGLTIGVQAGFDPMLLGLTLLIIMGGFIGSIIDSLLGEFFQAKYLDANQRITEVYHAGLPLIKGFSFIDNNAVNLLSNILSVGIHSCLAWALHIIL